MTQESRTGVFDLRETPELAELIRIHGRNMAVKMRTATVGTVTATGLQPLGYDPAQQLCSIEVQQQTTLIDPDDSTKSILQDPVVLANVPVAWPRTSAGYLTFPLAVGDTGELIIQDRSLTEWLKKGSPVDPIDNWTHNISDAVFHPGLHSKIDPILPPTDITATVLEGTTIKLGRTALPIVNTLVLEQALIAAMSAMFTAGIGAGTGAVGTTGTLAFTAAQAAWETTIAIALGTTKTVAE